MKKENLKLKNEIKIEKICRNDKKVQIIFKVNNILEQFFYSKCFWVEYDFNIDKIPDTILIIPFILNVLPIAWITNSNIIVDEIDGNFLNSIDEIRKAYVKMYPFICFHEINIINKKVLEKIGNNEKRKIWYVV